jgi:hypothetical protein
MKYQIVKSERNTNTNMSETTHALGHSRAEIQRLENQGNQGAMLRPITERLLRNPGIH